MGPEMETYRGNKTTMAVIVILAIGGGMLLFGAIANPLFFPMRRVAYPLLVVFASLFIWIKSVRVTIHTDGISYHSLFGEKEIRWDELERFEYGAIKQSVNFVPIGTYYHFKLVDSQGRKLRFGNRVESPAKLGPKIVEQSYPALFRKIADRYNSGEEVDFGAIRVSRTGGIKVKKVFGYKEIPWNQVSSYNIQQGYFYIWPVGVKRTRGPRIRQVPNAYVLLGLMNAVLKPQATS